MSDNEQKPGKILRTSSGKGKTRLTASGGDAEVPAAPADAPGKATGGGSAPGDTATNIIDAQADGSQPSGAQASATQTAGLQAGGAQADESQASATQTAGSQVGGAQAQSAGTADWSAAGSGQQGGGAPTRVSSASQGMRLSAGGAETRAQPTASGPDHGAAAQSRPGTGGPTGTGPTGSGPAGTAGVKATSSGVKMSGKAKKGPRTVRLTVASIDPWSVMKMSFLLSLAIAIAMLVATLVLWLVLQATGVMGNIESTMSEIAGAESADQLLALVSLGRVMATAFVLALVNIVLMTALSTLFAFLYNIGASIVGGFHLTLTDD